MEEYKPYNILITGCAGFIGSHFLEHALETYTDAHITGIDKMSYCSNQEFISYVQQEYPKFIFYQRDLLDATTDIPFGTFDTVIHFAASTHVDNSFIDPEDFVINNSLATVRLMQYVKGTVKRFIHISTDEVYGDSEEESSESTIPNPSNPYSASKLGTEAMVTSFRHTFGLPSIITRGNNAYGTRQYHEKLIPKFIMMLHGDEKVTIHGDGTNLRSFLHVKDTCNAVDIIMRKGEVGQIYNIASSDEYSVKDVAQKLISLIKPNSSYNEWIKHIAQRQHNDRRYKISCKPLLKLGWRQEILFDDGIRSLVY